VQIIIIGAGIGGLTAAILLKQQGHDIVVYERDKEPRTLGAGLVLWPNATSLLKEHHLLKSIVTDTQHLHYMHTYDNKGNILTALDINQLRGAMGDYPAMPIARKKLHQQLMAIANQLNIVFKFDSKLERITYDCDKTRLYFSNNSTAVADLIIGADGRMNSITRKFVVGTNTPCYMGYNNWVGLIEHTTSIDLQGIIKDFWSQGERFGMVPLGANALYWAGCIAMPVERGKSVINTKKYLLNQFQDWPKPIADVIQATDEIHINGIAVYDLDPANTFFKDNIVLIGDAAHAAGPTSSQGACLAIEDAFCLANAISTMTIPTALSYYQAKRVSKTTKITEYTRKLTKQIFEADPDVCQKRNQIKNEASEKDAWVGLAKLWLDD